MADDPERIGDLLVRVAELEAALHTIASETYDLQYERLVFKPELDRASRWHNIARAAIEPPVTKGKGQD